MPIAYLALLISFVFSPSKFSPVELFGNLFFLQTPEHLNLWFAPFCGNGPLWSLSYEVWFYLFFPILFCALSAFCANSSSVFALLSWPLGVISLGLNQLSSNPWSQFGSLFPIWVHGWWLAQMKFDRLRTGKTGFPAYIVFAAGLLTIESFLLPSSTLYSWGVGILLGTFLYVMVESEETGYLPKVKFMAWLGDGSFSMYAFHYPILISIREMGATTYQSAMVLMLLFCILPFFEKSITRRLNPLQ